MPLGANDLQIFGTDGMLITGPLRWVHTHHLTLRTPNGCKEEEYPADNLYLNEIEAFAEALAGEWTPAASGEDGLRLVRVTEALIRSLETGSAIPVES
jgi:1,5-anhydro-D-fructose reductase (1,5-anhydro-D-mannitol-forming)